MPQLLPSLTEASVSRPLLQQLLELLTSISSRIPLQPYASPPQLVSGALLQLLAPFALSLPQPQPLASDALSRLPLPCASPLLQSSDALLRPLVLS